MLQAALEPALEPAPEPAAVLVHALQSLQPLQPGVIGRLIGPRGGADPAHAHSLTHTPLGIDILPRRNDTSFMETSERPWVWVWASMAAAITIFLHIAPFTSFVSRGGPGSLTYSVCPRASATAPSPREGGAQRQPSPHRRREAAPLRLGILP